MGAPLGHLLLFCSLSLRLLFGFSLAHLVARCVARLMPLSCKQLAGPKRASGQISRGPNGNPNGKLMAAVHSTGPPFSPSLSLTTWPFVPVDHTRGNPKPQELASSSTTKSGDKEVREMHGRGATEAANWGLLSFCQPNARLRWTLENAPSNDTKGDQNNEEN